MWESTKQKSWLFFEHAGASVLVQSLIEEHPKSVNNTLSETVKQN